MKKMPVKVRLPWKHNAPSTMARRAKLLPDINFFRRIGKV